MNARENLGMETEVAILKALAYSEGGEVKQLPLTRQIANVLNLIHAERRHDSK